MHRLFLLLLIVAGQSTAASTLLYKVGVLDNKANITASYLQWFPTFDTYLNNYLAVFGATFRTETIALSFDDLTDAASSHTVDLTYTNTGHSATFGELYNFQPLLAIENFRMGQALSHFGGAVFVQQNSSIQTLEQCAGKKICAVSQSSYGGCVTQLKEMVDRGVPNVPQLVDGIVFTGSHEQVLYDTNDGLCDCGFVRTDKFEGTQLKFPSRVANLRHLSPKTGVEFTFFPFKVSTVLYPEWVVMASRNIPQEHQQLIETIMFSIRANHDAAIIGQYSRWFPTTSLADVVESLYATGQLPRPVPPKNNTLLIVSLSVGGIVILLVALQVGSTQFAAYRARKVVAAAPKDDSKPVALMFLAVESESFLWEQHPNHAAGAIKYATEICRKAIKKHSCYEVRRVGTSSMLVAAVSPENCAKCAAEIQQDLRDTVWQEYLPLSEEDREERERYNNRSRGTSEGGSSVGRSAPSSKHSAGSVGKQSKSSKTTATSRTSGSKIAAGLNGVFVDMIQFKVGIHSGSAIIDYDEQNNHYDYSGPVVDFTAAVCDVSRGGQILLSSSASDVVEKNRQSLFAQCKIGPKEKEELMQYNPEGQPVMYFAPPSSDGEQHDSLVNALEQARSGMSKKLVTILSVYMECISEASSTLVGQAFTDHYVAMSSKIVQAVGDAKGKVEMLSGNRLIASFNAGSSCPNQMLRAFLAVQGIREVCAGKIYCGIAAGRVVVGHIELSDFPHTAITGAVVNNAISLEKLCRRYQDVEVLTTSSWIRDIESMVVIQYLDIAPNAEKPDKPAIVASLLKLARGVDDETNEWMYELEASQTKNPYVTGNVLFSSLLSGSLKSEAIASVLPEVKGAATASLAEIARAGSIESYLSLEVHRTLSSVVPLQI